MNASYVMHTHFYVPVMAFKLLKTYYNELEQSKINSKAHFKDLIVSRIFILFL